MALVLCIFGRKTIGQPRGGSEFFQYALGGRIRHIDCIRPLARRQFDIQSISHKLSNCQCLQRCRIRLLVGAAVNGQLELILGGEAGGQFLQLLAFRRGDPGASRIKGYRAQFVLTRADQRTQSLERGGGRIGDEGGEGIPGHSTEGKLGVIQGAFDRNRGLNLALGVGQQGDGKIQW